MNSQALTVLIRQMEKKQIQDKEDVMDHLHTWYEKFTPFELFKTAINDIVPIPATGSSSILQTITGAAAGFISKKLFMGKSHNPIKEILGTLLEVKLAQYFSRVKEQ